MKRLGPFILFSWMVIGTACVNLPFGKSEVRKSSAVVYQAPSAPFARHEAKSVDAAWKNQKSGNIISFLSECDESLDPTLEAVRSDVARGMEDFKILKSESLMVQERKALRSTVSGQVDGVDSLVDLLIFKRNGCLYILTYVATPKTQSADVAAFDQFIKEFVAP